MARGSALKELLERKRAEQMLRAQQRGLSEEQMRRQADYIPPTPDPGREQRRDAFGERWFHGSRFNTRAKDRVIDEFSGDYGSAGHFTKDPEFANLFAGASRQKLLDNEMVEIQSPNIEGSGSPYRGDAGAVYPVRLNISDTFDAENPEHYERLRTYLRDIGETGNIPNVDRVEKSFHIGMGNFGELEYLADIIRRAGFDSYLDFEVSRGTPPGEPPPPEWGPTGVAVFDAKNIRSEFANFDEAQRESGNILAGIVPIGGATGLTLAALQSGEAEANARIPQRFAGLLEPLPGQPLNAQGRPISQPNIPGMGIVEIGPNERALRAAEDYARSSGVPYTPLEEYAPLDPDRARRIAREYDLMPHAPDDPEVARAYRQMIDETMGQYEAMLSQGVRPFFIRGDDPYAASPYLALVDLAQNNRLGVFPTRDGFGTSADFDPANNPLLAPTEFKLDGEPMLANDVFRAVHDYFGHAKPGVGFRAMGEENAYQSHAGMYSPLARRALASETRGQNSWLNFGPYGDTNRTAGIDDTVFADQKTGLMPRWATESGRVTANDRRQRFARDLEQGTTGLEGAIDPDGNVSLVHYSRAPRDRIDPGFYGTGLSGRTRAEVNRASNPEFTNRSYFGIETDERPYRRERGLGNVRNEAEIEGELLYPLDRDPEGFRARAREQGGDVATNLENLIAGENYSGYVTRHPALGTVSAIFDPLDTRGVVGAGVGLGALGLMGGAQEADAGVLDPSAAARLARAQEQGYDTSRTVYNGRLQDFEAFDPDRIGEITPDIFPQGIYTADDPNMANTYTERGNRGVEPGANVIPAYIRPGNQIDTTGMEWSEKAKVFEAFNRGEYDSIRNATEAGGITVVRDPSQIRSKFAAFDPERTDSPNLLAGGAAAAVGLGALAPEDAEAAQYYHGATRAFDELTPDGGEGTLYATPDVNEANTYAQLTPTQAGAVYPINLREGATSRQLLDEDFRLLRDQTDRLNNLRSDGVDYVTTDGGDQIAILNPDIVEFAAERGQPTAPEAPRGLFDEEPTPTLSEIDAIEQQLLGPQYDTPETRAKAAAMGALLAPEEGMTRDEQINLGLQLAGAVPEALGREVIGGVGMLLTGDRNAIYDDPVLDLSPAQDRAVRGALEPVGEALGRGIDAAGEAGYQTTMSILETPIAPGYKVGDLLMDAEEGVTDAWNSLSDSAKNRIIGGLAATGVLDVMGGFRAAGRRLVD